MKILRLIFLPARRWLDFFSRLRRDARAAAAANGVRGVAFELRARALAAYALFVGAPLVMGELVAAMIERENLIAAYRAGVAPEHYVREKCAGYGVAVGSPSYLAVLAWAWSLINHLESKGLI